MDFDSLDAKHVMTVARAPISAALPTFRAQAGWDALRHAHKHQHPQLTLDCGSDHKYGRNAHLSSADMGYKESHDILHEAALSLPMPVCVYKHVKQLTTNKSTITMHSEGEK